MTAPEDQVETVVHKQHVIELSGVVLTAQRGDTVYLRANRAFTQEELDALTASMETLPGGVHYVVLPHFLDVVRKHTNPFRRRRARHEQHEWDMELGRSE